MRYLFLAALCLIQFLSLSQDFKPAKDPAAIKAFLSKTAAGTTSLQATFMQKTISKMLTKPVEGTGAVYFKKSDKIRWEVSSPKKQVILVSGKQFRMQENGKEVKGVGQNKLGQKIQELMMSLFTGNFLNEKEFHIAYFENASSYRLYMVPKSSRMQKHLAALEMIFDKSKGTMKQMTMVQDESNRIIYSFTHVQMNTDIPDNRFTTF